jgi:3-oxoacyl-(acyl-carrier-protein) synthase
MITPLGNSPVEVLKSIHAGETAARPPAVFDAASFACRLCAPVTDFRPQEYVSEPKLARLMNRDAQFAVAAARLALKDAAITPGLTYPSEEIAIYGATGLAGLPLREVTPLIRASAGLDGQFDPARFGQAGLKAVSPILSFKILSNMPVCFVSINEGLRGPNAVFTPWEGDGAQAIEAGIGSIESEDARCAVVGGCDWKVHELAFATLQRHGVFSSWCEHGAGVVPAEGAAFLILEREEDALARDAKVYAGLGALELRPQTSRVGLVQTRAQVLDALPVRNVHTVVSSLNGEPEMESQMVSVLKTVGISAESTLNPKKHVGDLFAGAAPLQMALAAALARAGAPTVLATCFGHGNTQAACILERV